MRQIAKTSALALALGSILAVTQDLHARELANFDINVANAKANKALASGDVGAQRYTRQSTDVLGRAAFTWVQQDLSAAAKSNAGNPEAAARAHLSAILGAAKRSDDVTHSLHVRKVDTQRGGAQLVQFQSRIDGIAVFREDLALLMDANQHLVAMRGPLPTTNATAAKSLPKFQLDAPQAIAAALSAHDFSAAIAKRLQRTTSQGEYQHFQLDRSVVSSSGASVAETMRAKRVYFRTQAGLQPAWYVEAQVDDVASKSQDGYAHVISAVDGSVLFRINQIAHLENYTYRVWAENSSDRLPFPSPQGRNATPDPDGLPTNNVVPFIAQELRVLANAPFSRAATDDWLPAGVTVTSGNNVNAYADLVAPNGLGAGDLQPVTTAANTFDYLYNTNLAPDGNDTQKQAATVQLFYWINWLHDWFYDNGFTETDGNAQLSNYGRGGLGGDPIRAEAQDYNVENNANMFTPSDGFSPRMQMGLWGSNPKRDSSIDGSITAHEWGHFLSNRLVLDANGLDTEHASGMGEGWSDFIALLTSVKEEDKLKPTNAAFAGSYASAGYSANDSYRGVRRYPFSTDMSKSPLSLGHIVDGVLLPNGQFSDNTEVHNQGEIWALALWEAYVGMLNDTGRLSFAEAQNRAKDYLIAGLKLTPASPTMIEARDAILASILASGESADFAIYAAAFAKRGMGAGAFIPDRYSTTMSGTVESNAQGSDITVASATLGVPTGCDADAVLDQGETAKLTVALTNTGFAALPSATVNLSSSNPAITFPSGNTVSVGAIALFGTHTVQVPIRLDGSVAAGSSISVTATPDAPGINSPPGTAKSVEAYVQFDEAQRASATDTFDTLQNGWANVREPAGLGNAAWKRRAESSAWHWHGSDENSETVNWTQTPVMAVGSGPFTVTLSHRYSFESGSDGTRYDGGVIQTSIDGGATWANIDPTVAGYSTSTLSNCCDNPLAGQRAFVGRSNAFPLFATQVLNFGTAFANQSNFRLRFGVATDQSVTAQGWDIDVITAAGLTNTPFNILVPQAATCSVTNHKTLQGAMSGTYSSSARSGEGVLVDFGQVGGTPVVFFTWYTYGQTDQQWLVGSNVFSATDTSVAIDLINTSGASFGSGFDPQDVSRNPWGSVALTFPDCDTMAMTYQKAGGEAGTHTFARVLGRLASGQCNLLNGGQSGTYYSPSRSGEGVLIDFGQVGGTPIEFFTWYTYGAGTQQWLVGSQSFTATDASVSVDLIDTSGASFGNAFRPQDVVRTPWGRVTHRFIDCNTLELNYQKSGGESGTQVLTRALGRLGDGVCH